MARVDWEGLGQWLQVNQQLMSRTAGRWRLRLRTLHAAAASRSAVVQYCVSSAGCDEAPPEPTSNPAPVEASSSSGVAGVERVREAAAPTVTPTDRQTCSQVCATSSGLECGASEAACTEHCLAQAAASGGCEKEMRAALSCMASLAQERWLCGEEGFAELGPGACDVEQEGVMTCTLRQLSGK